MVFFTFVRFLTQIIVQKKLDGDTEFQAPLLWWLATLLINQKSQSMLDCCTNINILFKDINYKWHIVESITGSNGYLMQSNQGHYRSSAPVGHDMAQGRRDALCFSFGFGSNKFHH